MGDKIERQLQVNKINVYIESGILNYFPSQASSEGNKQDP